MKKEIKIITGSIILSAILSSCGSSTSNETLSNNPEPTPPNQVVAVSNGEYIETIDTNEILIGYFIDAEVSGVEYETTSGLKGTTDENGKFQYQRGDKVKLHIGNLNLGEVEPQEDGLVTPQTLSNGNDEHRDLLLRTLQALDSDNNTTNGITIPAEVTTSLHNINHTDIAKIDEEKLLKLNDHLALSVDKDFDGHIDTHLTDAHEHFNNSMNSWNNGVKPEHTTQSQDIQHNNSSQDCNNSLDINNMPLSSLTPELKNAIAYMGNEERLAYDVYHNLYDYHITNSAMQIEQLKNISERAEIKHIEIVQNLVRKYNLNSDELSDIVNPVADNTIAIDSMPSGEYDIETIQILYNALYSKGITSQKDALEVGCMVEVTDINDLDNYIKMAQDSKADDVIQSFEILRDGSYSHYWAFDKGLKNIGISDGCCSLGKVDGVDYCHNEYPTHEHNEDGEHNIDKVEQQHIDTYQENKKGKGKGEHKLFEVSN
jgi:hypothetical protein